MPWDELALLAAELDISGPPEARVTSARRRQVQVRLDDVAVAQMARDYEGGLSIAAVARRYGVNQETAASRLRKHGVEIRPLKGSIPAKHLDEARQLRAAGWTYEALGRKYGCSGVAVRRTLLRTAWDEIGAS